MSQKQNLIFTEGLIYADFHGSDHFWLDKIMVKKIKRKKLHRIKHGSRRT